MAKILISSLGTGQKREGGYQKAIYSYNKQEIETTFISKALSKMLKIDKLFLVGTKGSIWDSVYKEFEDKEYNEEIELEIYEKIDNKTITEKELKIVNEAISKNLGLDGSKCFLIEYGKDDDELWSNFEKYLKILDHVNNDDIVYIDITHAFRSLSLMSFLMVQFGHIIKNKRFKIGGVFYGMFEVSRENNGITPIVDLKILYDLMEWIKAIDNFKNYANGDNISILLKGHNDKNEFNIFNNYTNAMRIANMAAVKQNINSISKKLNLLEESQNPIIRLMSEEMREFVSRLDKEKMSDFQLSLAEWYCEHKHYALSYMALAEAIVSKSCEKNNYPIDSENGRNSAKKEIFKIDKTLSNKIYKPVNKIRNAIAHQLQTRKDSIISDINNLPRYIKDTQEIFSKLA